MSFTATFEDIAIDALHDEAEKLSADGWRAQQVLCTKTDTGIDITYSFTNEGEVRNLQVRNVQSDTVVPSLQDLFIGLFPFENEAKDLFGVNVEGMVLDFAGEFYQTRLDEPMTILTPEAKERLEKEAKKAAAKAAKADGDAKGKDVQGGDNADAKAPKVLTDEEIEAKVANLPPDKAEKVRAALKAKQAASAKDGE